MVAEIYTHPAISSLIAKIKPQSIQDDLKQEIALSLLEQPCDKIAALFAKDNLLRYSMRVCWIMATSKNSGFYKKFRKSDIVQAVEYLRLQTSGSCIPLSFAYMAQNALNGKNATKHEDHEARIFNKYIELGSCLSVAKYFGIPYNHTRNVVLKVQAELKQILKQ